MLHRVREPFGKAGLIVAVVAMVTALVGGAYAASSLTGKQKKEVKKIAKKFAGKDGAPGAVGPVGPPGPKGDAGVAGTNGTNGTDGEDGEDGDDGAPGAPGENVNVIKLEPGDNPECPEGGSKLFNGTGEAYACNGKNGDGGFADTLTGWWENLGEDQVTVGEFSLTTIGFPYELDAPPAEIVFYDPFDHTPEEELKCPSANSYEPKAADGVLCVYQIFGEPELEVKVPQKIGAQLFFKKTGPDSLGTWAYNIPEPVETP